MTTVFNRKGKTAAVLTETCFVDRQHVKKATKTFVAIVEAMFVNSNNDVPIAILQSLILSPRVLESSSTPNPRILVNVVIILLITFPIDSKRPAIFIASSCLVLSSGV